MFPFQYTKLGDFTYHVLTEPVAIKQLLMRRMTREWETDHREAPDEPWTVEWLTLLPRMEFTLNVVPLANIHPRSDLMAYTTPTYSFARRLAQRADEREEAMLRGVSIEPLLVHQWGLELMDGYTRYTILQRYKQRDVFAYIGTVVR